MISKSFTDRFVRRPVIALVVNIAILVVGVVAYFQLNTRQYPRSDAAVVNVTTVYYGASADTVRGYIDSVGTSDRECRRDRLPRIDQRGERQHDQSFSAA